MKESENVMVVEVVARMKIKCLKMMWVETKEEEEEKKI